MKTNNQCVHLKIVGFIITVLLNVAHFEKDVPHRLDCNFQNDICNWKTENLVTYPKAGQSNSLDSPEYPSAVGKAFIELRRSSPGQLLHLQAQLHEYSVPNAKICLHFRLYAISQQLHDQVHVSVQNYHDEQTEEEDAQDRDWNNQKENSRSQPAWHLIKVIHDLDQDEWTDQFVQLNHSMNKIRITSNLTAISLSEMKAKTGECPPENICSFEPGSECNQWFETGLKNNYVQLVQARDGVCRLLPHKDTSTASPYGHYLSFLKAQPTMRIFEIPLPNRQELLWLDMQLYMPKEECLKLSAYVEYEDGGEKSRQIVWSSDQMYPSDRWQRVLAPFELHFGLNPMLVLISGQSAGHQVATMALDDLHIKFGHTHKLGSCDFHHGLCGYTNTDPATVAFVHGNGRLFEAQRVGLPSSAKNLIDTRRHLYLDLTWLQPGVRNVLALLRSEFLRPVRNGGCATVTYNFYCQQPPTDEMHFKVFQTTGNKREQKFQAKPSTSEGFLIRQFNVISSSPFVLEIEFSLQQVQQQVPLLYLREIEYDEQPCLTSMDQVFEEEEEAEDDEKDRMTAEMVDKVQKNIDCRFDIDTCQFNKYGNGWTLVGSASEARKAHLPLVDPEGVKIQKRGYYAAKLSGDYPQQLQSHKIQLSKSSAPMTFCLHGYYFFSQDCQNCLLRMNLKELDHGLLFEATSGSLGSISSSAWRTVRDTVQLPAKDFIFQMTFEGQQGHAAIRDLSVKYGRCSLTQLKSHSCTFEDPHCDFEPHLLNRPRFRRISSSVLGIHDHSLNNEQGHVLAVHQGQLNPNELGPFTSEVVFPLPQGNYLFSFWTNMNCDCVLELIINDKEEDKVVNEEMSSLVQIRNPVPQSAWHVHWTQLEMTSDNELMIRLHSKNFDHGQYFAMDDLNFQLDEPATDLCDVDSRCYWQSFLGPITFKNSKNIEEKRQQLNSFVVSSGAAEGPSCSIPVDHTIGDENGLYLYLNSPYDALLQSPQVGKSEKDQSYVDDVCIQFAYFIPKKNLQVGQVSQIHIRVLIGSGDQRDLQESSNLLPRDLHYDQWQFVQLNVSLADLSHVEQVNVYLLIDSTNPDDKGILQMALDDLIVLPGTCVDENAFVPSDPNRPDSQPVLVSQLCNFHHENCGDCTFKQDLCGYENKEAQYEWQLSSQLSTSSSPLAKPVQPFVRVIKRKEQSSSKSAILQSKDLPNSYATCTVEIHYASESFDFQIKVLPKYEAAFTLWYGSSSQHDLKVKTLTLGTIKGPFQLMLKARPVIGVAHDLVLTDIRFLKCALPDPGPEFPCPNHMYTCENNVCIDREKVCDHVLDCGAESSDEMHCDYDRLRCDFEGGLCEWFSFALETDEMNQFQLTYGHERTDHGPGRDHTHNRRYGYFLELEYDWQSVEGTRAAIASGMLHYKTGCAMRFYYMCHRCQIKVTIRKYSVDGKLFATEEHNLELDSEDNWSRATLSLQSDKPILADILLETSTNRFSHFVALDDVSFTSDCYSKLVGQIDCNFGNQWNRKYCDWEIDRQDPLVTNFVRDTLNFVYDDQKEEDVKEAGKEESVPNNFPDHSNAKSEYKQRSFRLLSPVSWSPDKSPLYVRMKYRMFDIHARQVILFESLQENKPIWIDNQVIDQQWQEMCISYPMTTNGGGPYRLGLEVQMHFPHEMFYLSQFTVNRQPCDASRCTFETTEDCHQLINNMGDWKMKSVLKDKLVLPSAVDHSTRTVNGGYAMIMSKFNTRNGLRLIPISLDYNQCLNVWFAQFSITNAKSTPVSLIEIRTVEDQPRTLFKTNLIQNDVWFQAFIDIPQLSMNKFLELEIVGSIDGDENEHVLALDDVQVRPETCQIVNCDFDQVTACDWHSQILDKPAYTGWAAGQLNQLHLLSKSQMPSTDVSSHGGEGGVLYTYFSRHQPSRLSALASSMLNIADGGQCLTFYYWMTEHSNLTLEVWTMNSFKSQRLLQLQSTQKGLWQFALVNIEKLDDENDANGQLIEVIAKNREYDLLPSDSEKEQDFMHNAVLLDLIFFSSNPCTEYDKQSETNNHSQSSSQNAEDEQPNKETPVEKWSKATQSNASSGNDPKTTEWYEICIIGAVGVIGIALSVVIVLFVVTNARPDLRDRFPFSLGFTIDRFMRPETEDIRLLFSNNQTEMVELGQRFG